MALLDIFSGDSGTAAAARAKRAGNKGLKSAEKKVKKGYEQGREDLRTGKTEALGFLQGGQQYYEPIAQIANPALGRYDEFFGGGGAQGAANAQANWQMSPLYQAMTNQNELGVQGLDRQAYAGGNRNNFTDKAQYLAQNAGKYLGDYTSGLWNIAGQALPIANAQAGLQRNMSDVATGTAGSMNANRMLGANQMSNLAQTQGQNNAQYQQNAYGAQQGANQNMWNAILSGAQLGGDVFKSLAGANFGA